MTVAILYCDKLGCYPKLAAELDLDCWDESRDARKYAGPWPVVAHPPCRNYSKLRKLAKSDYSDCAIRAVEQVRQLGGVLEHPAGSRLWERCGLPYPCSLGALIVSRDDHGGFTVAVSQVEWGHVARKHTWLYCVGVPWASLERAPYPGQSPTHWLSGFREHSRTKQTGAAVPPGIKVCSAQQRRRTPIEFARYLVRLAEAAGRARAERVA